MRGQAYRAATPLEPDAALRIDREAARLLAAWYHLGQALAAFATAVTDDEPELFQTDPHWHDQLWFHEYFHGDTEAGLGAAHQTGWAGLVVACLLHRPTPLSKSRAPDHDGQPDTLSRCPPLRHRPAPR